MKKIFFSKKFISATKEYCTTEKYISAPLFRKTFFLAEVKSSWLTICGLGFYKLYINGKEITKGKFAPYISNPDDLLYYDSYELFPYLRKGKNVIGILLGNGFLNCIGGKCWDFDKASFRSAPKVAMTLMQEDSILFECDESFKVESSPIFFDDIRMGEFYDATQEIVNWATVEFDDAKWKNARKAIAPKGTPTLCNVPSIYKEREIKPKKIVAVESGYLFDFGINTAGICRLTIDGIKGQKIDIRYGEVLLENKSLYLANLCNPSERIDLKQRNIYICKGEKEEIYEPSFMYSGFRYVFIKGLKKEQLSYHLLTMLVYHANFSDYSSFKCDHKIINQLQKMTLNSDLSNFFYFPTDCPQREKNGWTGDIAISVEQLLYNFDCSASLREWLKNVRAAQKPTGELPGIVPTSGWGFAWGNGPAWDISLIEATYQIYRFTGEAEVLRENACAIQKYIYYLVSKINTDGLVAYGLPDWCEAGAVSEDICSTPLEITDSLTIMELLRKAGKIFEVLKKEEEKEKCFRLRNNFRAAFRKKYLNQDLYVNCYSQTAQAKAISEDIFEEKEKVVAVENLVALIEKNNNFFKVGVLGGRVLFDVLSENGYSDLALKMITQKGFPSYRYWVDNGCTALAEGFNETYKNSVLRKDGGRVLSYNHHFWGFISAWFYKYITGAIINPDFNNPNKIILAPKNMREIGACTAEYRRNGKILRWKCAYKNDKIEVQIIKNSGFLVSVLPC